MAQRDDTLRFRAQNWLRSEKALGLPSIRRPAPSADPAMTARPTPPSGQPARPAIPTAAAASARLVQAVVRPQLEPLALLASAPIEGPELAPAEKRRLLDELNELVTPCAKCGLAQTRTHTVFGEGDSDARLVFVGEGPGRDEDASGRPFVGRAGQKLNDMIHAMGLQREQVFICNVVKCRAHFVGPPAKDRAPTEEEVAACSPHLVRQLEIIRPKVIVTLGLAATRYLLDSKLSMSRMRGQWHQWRGIKVMPTWHPAYVLRNYTPQTRAEVWDDLRKVMKELGLPQPKPSGKSQPNSTSS